MRSSFATLLSLSICLIGLQIAAAPGTRAAALRVLFQKTVSGFGHIESAAYDAADKVFYLSNFGPALRPAAKDGEGHITKMSLDGKILQRRVFPTHGKVMNKPKGIWIANGRLWVTDIDSIWEFDLKTKKSRRLPLPGIIFANDSAVMDGALYVSDNEADKVVARRLTSSASRASPRSSPSIPPMAFIRTGCGRPTTAIC